MSRQILSLDIRTDQLSAVLLNAGLKNSTIADCVSIALETGLDAAGDDADSPVDHALTALAERMDPASASIVVLLPMDQVFFRTLTVPFKDDNKIRQILPFELEPIVPVNIDNLTIDFHEIAAGDQNKIFAVAIDSAVLNGYMTCFTQRGLHPQLVVPCGFPLAMQISGLEVQVPGHTLILNVDRTKTTLFALAGGKIALVRTIACDLSTDSGTESFALKVRQTLTALGEGQPEAFSPSAVHVSGPGLLDNDYIARLSKALDLPVGTIDFRRLLANVDMAPGVQWDPNHYNDALSLAYLEADGGHCPNFHNARSTFRNYWINYRPVLVGPLVLLAAVLLLGLAGVFVESYFLQKQVNMQNAQIAEVFTSTFPDTRLTASPLDQMKSKLKEVQKGNLAGEHTGAVIPTIDILLEISQQVPESVNVVFNRMAVGGNAVTVSGETPDFNTVDDVKGRIENSGLFRQVTIASANMDKSGKKVRFRLKIDL